MKLVSWNMGAAYVTYMVATGEIPTADGSPMLVASAHTRAAEAPEWMTAGQGIEAYPVETLDLSDHAPLVLELDMVSGTQTGEDGIGVRERHPIDAHA